jgi:LPXTG-site transpeptidase (sortase) family protein
VDPPAGAAVGKLEIPAIGLSQIVVEGTDEDDLAEGPGHYIGTALPGYSGNVAIAGHRTTYGAPFNRLAEVAKGDMIFLTATDGAVLPYRVVATPSAVAPTDVSVLGDFDDNRVTLTTCTPEFSAAQRLVVVADFVGAATSSATAPTASTTGSAPTRLQGPSLSPAVAKVLARWAADRGARSRAPKVGAPPSGAASGSGRPDRGNSPRSVSATITENAVTQGWNLDGLPSVTRWVILLVVLGAIYGRVRRRLGWAAFAVLVPAWGLGLYFLFQALAGFLPAGM